MTVTVTRKHRIFTPKQLKHFGVIAKSVNSSTQINIEPMLKAMESLKVNLPDMTGLTALSEQMKSSMSNMEPILKDIERTKALLPDMTGITTLSKQIQESIPNMELINIAVKSVQLIPKITAPSTLHESEPNVIMPRRVERREFYPEENDRLNRIEQKLEVIAFSVSEKREVLPIPSIFDWNTLDLVIEGEQIKLTATEKNVCCAFFKNHPRKWMPIETLEYAVYGTNNSASKALEQTLKRINQKVREAGFSNIFRVEGKNVLLIR